MGYLDPNRPLPRMLACGLDAIVERCRRHRWPASPSPWQRKRRYEDALAYEGEADEHAQREVHGAELQANLRAYGTTIDLRMLAQAMYREEMARRARAQKLGSAVVRFRPTRWEGQPRG